MNFQIDKNNNTTDGRKVIIVIIKVVFVGINSLLYFVK
ncbi:putative membrane protein [[Clostridium] bifermentans ATCC 638]|uniref:Putative membrane protein n=1 Tax=Paraclostridium bifermentans ATCC 638 = DSM 14991 TaxID=1233171 RepID=T4VHQ3_PARBF|nr:putative membrane protein [[Clostridium] bifermentans ATCC 638] [Paraclostridium bifermentans ATCC 638 = DSM 14991]